jgi:hypothetical protein
MCPNMELDVIAQMLSWLILKQINQVMNYLSRLYFLSYIIGPAMIVKCKYICTNVCVCTHILKTCGSHLVNVIMGLKVDCMSPIIIL